MKLNYLITAIMVFLIMGLNNKLYSQYSKLEGRELESFQKEIINKSKNKKDLLVLIELTIKESNNLIEKLKPVLDPNTHIWYSIDKLSIVVSKKIEKSEYSIIKKWLFDHEIKIKSLNRFFVTTSSK